MDKYTSVVIDFGKRNSAQEYDNVKCQIYGSTNDRHKYEGELRPCKILKDAHKIFEKLYQYSYPSDRRRYNNSSTTSVGKTKPKSKKMPRDKSLDDLWDSFEKLCREPNNQTLWLEFKELLTWLDNFLKNKRDKRDKDPEFFKAYLKKWKPIYSKLLNRWLTEPEFGFSDFLKKWNTSEYLKTNDEITLILQPSDTDVQFWRYSFDSWDLLKEYPYMTVAFGQQEYKEIPRKPKKQHQVRILVFISEDEKIDYKNELYAIEDLEKHGAEIQVKKSSSCSKEEFKEEITKDYDFLIFIGHSQTEGRTGEGKFYLNEEEFLTISELNESLKSAITNGLRLAIFNSCDGMGLGNDLSKLYIDNVIVMKEDVTNRVAEFFLKSFILAFVKQKLSLPMAFKQAKKQLSEAYEPLEPCASQLPTLWINAGVKTPLTWDELRLGTIVYPDWGNAPDINDKNFLGREEEQEELKTWIVTDKCKVVTIEGLPGIGKTGLSIKVAQSVEVQQEFDYIIWRSLLNAPSVEEIITDVINFISNNQANILEDNLQKKIDDLLKYLQDSRCLIILDNADTITQQTNTNNYPKEYEGYALLFQALAERLHNSCLLLTTRSEITTLQLKTSNTGSIRLRKLEGLDNEDGKKILTNLKKHRNQIQGLEEDYEKIIKYYEGNPLALHLIGGAVLEEFDGNLSEFIEQEENQLLKTNKTIYRDKLDRLVGWRFQRLSPPEKELMYWLGINLEPVSYKTLSEDCLEITTSSNIKHIVESLETQGMLLESAEDSPVSLQPVLLENMRDNLIHEVVKEIQNGKLDFLNRYTLFKTSVKESLQDAQIKLILNPIYEQILPDNSSIIKEIKNNQEKLPPQIEKVAQKIEDILTLFNEIQELELSTLEQYFQNILSHIRANQSLHNGYGAGNLLNILLQCHKQEDFFDYDFSGLTIRNGYFLERNLHNINFQNSTFEKCVFTQIFSDIYSLKISPDGKRLVFGDSQSQVKLWKLDTNEPLYTFMGHEDVVWSVDISQDGKYIASGSEDSTVKLWDVDEGKLSKTFEGHKQWVYSVVFSHKKKYLASGSKDGAIILWDVVTRTRLHDFSQHEGSVWSVAFSPDDKYLASGSEDGTIILWDVENGKYIKTFSDHQEAVRCVVFSPDGQYLASGSEDGTIILWEVKEGNLINKFSLTEHNDIVISVAFSQDSKYLASGSENAEVRLWDLQERKSTKSTAIFSKHNFRVRAVAFTPDDKYIVSGAEDKTIRIWNVKDRVPVRTISGHTNQLLSIAFNPQGNWLASSSEKYKVKLWNLETEKYIALQGEEGHGDWVWSVAFSPDGKKLASVSEDEIVKIWDVKQERCIRDLKEHKDWIWTVAFHPTDNQILASAGVEKKVIIWYLDERPPLLLEQKHTDDIWGVAFSPDGNYLASASHDGTIGIWLVDTGEFKCFLDKHEDGVWQVAFSPDGNYLASASKDGRIGIWDAQSFNFLKFLKVEDGHKYWVESVAFSPDSQTLVSIDNSHTIIKWSLQTTQWIFEKILFEADTNTEKLLNSRECRIAFSPTDGQVIAHSGYDQAVTLRDINTGECLKTLRPKRPYEGMKIAGVKNLNEPQKNTLIALGGTEKTDDKKTKSSTQSTERNS